MAINYRGVLTVFFDGVIAAMNPYPKPWKFRVVRRSKGWDGDVWMPQYVAIDMTAGTNEVINGASDYPETDRDIKAMNPVHIIYECLTNRVWGRGLDRSRIGPTFEAAAATCHAEGFGLCIKWARQSEIEQFVQGILDTIGANIYTNRSTGKLEIKLIRNDYTASSLPLFEPGSGLLEVSEASVVAPSAQITECVVNYHDPITDKDRKVRVQNLGAIHGSSAGVNTLSKSYTGIPTPELAAKVAQRDLKATSSRIRKFSFTLDRRGWQVYPGDVIRIRDPYRHIPDTVVRVGTVDDGTFEDGRIKIVGLQDVFALPSTSFTSNEPSRWTAPDTSPCTGRFAAFEMPYFLAMSTLTQAEFAALDGGGSLVAVAMEEGKSLNNGFDVFLKQGAISTNEVAVDSSYTCPI